MVLKESLIVDNIPAILWGEKSDNLFIAVHGNMSSKNDECIAILAEQVVLKGYQVLSFDLPEHGDRKDESAYICSAQNCIHDLDIIMKYAQSISSNISLFACSIGAYFSLIAYSKNILNHCFFLSPVVDMERLIENMMSIFNVSEDRLMAEKEIILPIGQKLYWDYYCFVREHSVNFWNTHTAILYGENDDICEFAIIKDFVGMFGCDLTVMQGAEHYFHTTDQLEYFKQWIKRGV